MAEMGKLDGLISPEGVGSTPASGYRVVSPRSWQEWTEAYGNIDEYVEMKDGISKLSPQWEAEKLVSIDLPFSLRLSWDRLKSVMRIRVHRYCMEPFRAVFDRLERERLSVYVYEYGGVYAYRKVRSGTRLSSHAYGAAIDLNPETNQLGSDGDMNPDVVAIFEAYGFIWGGRWMRKDPMHFQFGRDWQ